ncbi:class II aldolase/adducin family protein [Nocardia brasiliensis]|uniref:class II aldolase/adducin family protein n=1 Tax=Nocardia brasiliensis TaxID=37326 RepID=UPI0036725FE1
MTSAPHPAGRDNAAERVHRQRQLAASLRLFARYGFDEGAGGHLTARDPEFPDRFWINPFGLHFGQVRVADLLLVDRDGTVVQGNGRINPAGFAIHSQVHEARPDVVAVAHAHSVHGRAWSTLGRLLDPLTQDACAFFEDHAVYAEYQGVVLGLDEAKRIAAALGAGKALIMRNHGLLTVGGSVGEAVWWFIAMDRSCQVQLLAEAAGDPVPIEPSSARSTRDTIGSPELGRLNFRPLFADIVHREPGLLE